MRSTLVVFLFLLAFPLFAQTEADSLRRVLKSARQDTNRVRTLSDLAWELKISEPDEARAYLREALQLAEQLNDTKGLSDANNYLGIIEDIHGNPRGAIEFFQRSLDLREAIGDRLGTSNAYNNIANVYENLGESENALINYRKALRLREELNDLDAMTRIYYNLSILHQNMGNYPEALDYVLLYRETAERNNDQAGMARAYNVLGNIKMELDRTDEAIGFYRQALHLHEMSDNLSEASTALTNMGNAMDEVGEDLLEIGQTAGVEDRFLEALEYHQRALDIRKELQDPAGQAEVLNNIGLVYKNLGSYYETVDEAVNRDAAWDNAVDHLRRALTAYEAAEDQTGVTMVYNGISDVLRRQKKFREALGYTQEYYTMAQSIGNYKFQQNALKDLARIHYALNDFQKAYDYRKQYDELRYSRFSEQRIKDNERREVLYSDNKKQYEIDRQEQELRVQEAELNRGKWLRRALLIGTILMALVALLLFNRYRLKNRSARELAVKNDLIETERRRAEDLLLNILPASVAEELKTAGKAKARRYEEATICFTDFKGFTQISQHLSPEEVVEELHTCFVAFDEIIGRYGLEKIKTIGDAYMFAGGIPQVDPQHAHKVVRAALEIIQFMETYNERKDLEGKPRFEIRVGVHSGPVVAGIVGDRKFAYDIWGDAVNTAARVEQTSEPGRLNISEDTYRLIRDEFHFEERGLISAKHKGKLRMYFVEQKQTV